MYRDSQVGTVTVTGADETNEFSHDETWREWCYHDCYKAWSDMYAF